MSSFPSRSYCRFFGLVLLVFGIAGLAFAFRFLGALEGGKLWGIAIAILLWGCPSGSLYAASRCHAALKESSSGRERMDAYVWVMVMSLLNVLWLAFMEFVQAVGMNMNERGTSVDWLLVWVFLLAIPFNFVLSLLAWKARSMEAQCLFKDEQPT